MPEHANGELAVVIIGRNEGERLRRCLISASGPAPLIYVDSGSEDDSVELARSLGATVLELDSDSPFTAARGRNTGWRHAEASYPSLRFVQFVDGDCELSPTWLSAAASVLDRTPEIAAVCGRLRERHPDKSIYNRLCDLEWDRPPGEISHCGGNSMMQIEALRQSEGFDAGLICGEEVELCHGFRSRGWKVVRIEDEMAWHDAEMTRFGQWWKRSVRSGYGYAEEAWRNRKSKDKAGLKRSISIWAWSGFLPLLAIGMVPIASWWSLAFGLLYAVTVLRGYLHQRQQGRSRKASLLCSTFWLLAKFPQLQGQIRFLVSKLRRSPTGLIEYRRDDSDVPG